MGHMTDAAMQRADQVVTALLGLILVVMVGLACCIGYYLIRAGLACG